MSTNYPISLDTFASPTATSRMNNPPHNVQHDNANDAIVALQAKVGINESTDPNSLDYKVSNSTISLPRNGGTMSGSIAMGMNKITGLANGTASSDAATFGQIPISLPPSGSAGGDLSGTFPNPTLKATGPGVTGPIGDEYTSPVITIDAKGRVTALSSATIATDGIGTVTDVTVDSTLSVSDSTTTPTLSRAALTGDITASAGSNATTLKNTGPGSTGPIGSATAVPVITIDAQGRTTALTSANITIAESAVTNLTTDLAAKLALSGGTMSGAIAMGSHKITGLTNGSASTDAAAFGQIPVLGQVLAQKSYATTSSTNYNITTTGGVLDTTNLTTGSFTVPTSGNIRISCSAWVSMPADAAGLVWWFANHSGAAVVGPHQSMLVNNDTTFGIAMRLYYEAIITGLTGGSSLQLDLAAYVTAGSNATLTVNDGFTAFSIVGPALFMVYAA